MLQYSNHPALREPAERGGSGLLADFAQKCVVSQRPAILLGPSGTLLSPDLLMLCSLNAGWLLYCI